MRIYRYIPILLLVTAMLMPITPSAMAQSQQNVTDTPQSEAYARLLTNAAILAEMLTLDRSRILAFTLCVRLPQRKLVATARRGQYRPVDAQRRCDH